MFRYLHFFYSLIKLSSKFTVLSHSSGHILNVIYLSSVLATSLPPLSYIVRCSLISECIGIIRFIGPFYFISCRIEYIDTYASSSQAFFSYQFLWRCMMFVYCWQNDLTSSRSGISKLSIVPKLSQLTLLKYWLTMWALLAPSISKYTIKRAPYEGWV